MLKIRVAFFFFFQMLYELILILSCHHITGPSFYLWVYISFPLGNSYIPRHLQCSEMITEWEKKGLVKQHLLQSPGHREVHGDENGQGHARRSDRGAGAECGSVGCMVGQGQDCKADGGMWSCLKLGGRYPQLPKHGAMCRHKTAL